MRERGYGSKKNESIQKALAILLLFFVPLFFIKEYKTLFANKHKTIKSQNLSIHKPKTFEREKSFVVFIFSTDQAPFNLHNFQSVLNQDYGSFEVAFVDLSSSGNNLKKAKLVVGQLSTQKKIAFYKPSRQKDLGEVYTEILKRYKDDQILIPILANDQFINELVLRKLNHIYQDPNVWLTYSFEKNNYNPNYLNLNRKDLSLKTFYIGLIKQLDLKELFQFNKNSDARDVILKGLLKLSKLHSRFIPDKLCTQNETKNYPSHISPKKFLEKLRNF